LSWGRAFDVLALLVIGFVIWKLLIAPRSLREADAHPAPQIQLATLHGPQFTLAKHHGRIVFLDFWATWCEPCRLSMPMVERFARKHPEVDVIPVDVGEPRGLVAQYAGQHGIDHVALDNKSLAAAWFGVIGFPTMVVVDRKGLVRATWPGFNPAVELNMANAAAQLR